jgi:hypothetical protein
LREADDRSACDNATPFLWAFGHVVVAWLWLDQATAAARGETNDADSAAFIEGKMRACRYFFEAELPKVGAWLSVVGARSDVAASAPTVIF